MLWRKWSLAGFYGDLCEGIGLYGAQKAFGQGRFPPNPTRKSFSPLSRTSGPLRAPGPPWWIAYSLFVGLWPVAGVGGMAAGPFY